MIRVNLAKPKAGQAKAAGAKQSSAKVVSDEQLVENELKRGLYVRIVILLLGPVILYLYQDNIIPEKTANLRKLQAEYEEVAKKNRDAAASVEEIKKFEKDEERLQAQINTLNSIRKDRVKEIRVLDYIQREIPQKVWLTQVDLNDGKLAISGIAMADTELTTFMDSLQRSAYLKDVNLLKSNDVSNPDFGQVKKFDITCSLEKAQ